MLDSIPFICFLSFLVDAGVDDDGLERCISSSQRECCLELSWCWPRRAEAERRHGEVLYVSGGGGSGEAARHYS